MSDALCITPAGSSNLVDARVWSLRKKVGPHGEMIETVPGAGYRFRRV